LHIVDLELKASTNIQDSSIKAVRHSKLAQTVTLDEACTHHTLATTLVLTVGAAVPVDALAILAGLAGLVAALAALAAVFGVGEWVLRE
jgi:hypothetical protein